MSTLRTYSYTLGMEEKKKKSRRKGVQTLRGSHDIIPGQPLQVGNERQLLMDWHILDDMNGCYRTVHQPVKHPDNPIVKAEQPCEGTRICSFGTVIREPDTGLFRMWTPCYDLNLYREKGKTRAVMRGLYYESDDGLEWRRPELGIIEHDGSKANNIFVQSYTDHLFVLHLPKRMHHRGKYALQYFNNLSDSDMPNPEREYGGTNFIAFSEDGIHFKDAPENPVWRGRSDTGNAIVYNPQRDVFMMYRRATINAGEVRRIAYSESKDLISWTQPINIVHREENDPLMLYSLSVTPYHGVYMGQLLRLHAAIEDRKVPNGKDHQMDTELAWSRDGIDWQRHPNKPDFIPTSPSRNGSYDWAMTWGMSNIIEMDDHLRVYYGGHEFLHGGYRVSGDPQHASICMGTLRRDGFVSVDANEDGGYMLTRPLAYSGGKLHINAKTASDGFIKVAVREGEGVRDGEWNDDWYFDKSVPFTGDSLDHVMTWQGAQSPDSFVSKTLRLHFWMEQSQLYSFWFEQ